MSDDEKLKKEMEETANRLNVEVCKIYEKLAEEGVSYEAVTGATVMSTAWLLAALVNEEAAYGHDAADIMYSFLGVLTGHSPIATESLFEAVNHSQQILLSVIELMKKEDNDHTTDETGGTLH